MSNNITPTDTDVLLGRGVATNRHPGNENFRAIIAQHVVSLHLIFDLTFLYYCHAQAQIISLMQMLNFITCYYHIRMST